MAVTLEELQLKYKSEIASVTNKDEAALSRLDAAVRSSQRGLEAMRRTHAANASAARVAAREQKIAESQLVNARPEDQAMRLAAAKRAQVVAARAAAREEASAAKLGEVASQHKALVSAKPELAALAQKKRVLAEETAAARRAAKEQESAAKALASTRAAASDEAAKNRMDATRLALTGAAGAAIAFGAAIAGAGVAAAAFGLSAAGAARDARILADALTGSERLGGEFDAVVGQLANKVPMARAQIAGLARELNLMRLGRRDMQAGLTAIAITTSAIGDSAGNVIKGVVQSSAAMRRFSLGARDMWGEYTGLAGSGLKKADVLSALAKQLGVSQGEVEKRLLTGRIKLSDGMKALEAATQARFGKTIAAQMLSVNTQFDKAKEGLAGMLSGVDLDPALRGLEQMLSIFDESTASGAVMKTILQEGIGGVSMALGKLLPLGKEFFLEMAIGAMEIYLALRPVGRQIMSWVGPLLTAENAGTLGKIAIYGLAVAFGLVAVAALAAAAAILLPFAIAGVAIWALVKGLNAAWSWLVNDATSAASNLIDSFIAAISAGVDRVGGAMRNLASKASDAFKSALGIASPSRVFAAFGRYTVQGFAAGVDQEAPQAQDAVDAMAPTPQLPGGVGARLAGGGPSINVSIQNLYLAGQKATEQDARSLSDAVMRIVMEQMQAALGQSGAGMPAGAMP
jgi:hypothetical protein